MSSTDGPLAGLRIAVTRPEADAPALARLLADAGAAPLIASLTRIVPPADDTELISCAARIESYDWVVFTSANAVRVLTRYIDWHKAAGARIAVVGSSTADALRVAAGRAADLMPGEFTGDALSAALQMQLHSGARVLWPKAAAAGAAIASGAAAAGALLDAPVAYATMPDADAARLLARSAGGGAVDVITFTAPSAVHAFARAGGPFPAVVVGCVGPATAMAASGHRIRVDVMPEEHTLRGLVDALSDFYRSRQ